MGIAGADEFALGHDDEGVGAFDAAEGADEGVLEAAHFGLGEHHDDDLAVHGGLEDEAAVFEFFAEDGGVGQIAVMGDGDLAAGAVHGKGLGIPEVGAAGGGVAGVADGAVADEVVEDFAIENLGDEAHAVVLVEAAIVAGDYAGAFLPPVLEGVKAVISEFGGIRMSENAEDTAIMFGIMLLGGCLHRARAEFHQTGGRQASQESGHL